MESPEHGKRQVREYFEWQAPDETIEHLERVASERIYADDFDVWDVHTEQGRWWVISNPMNLYTQADFKSMDVALTFHIGLGRRVLARDWKPASGVELELLAAPWRRLERANEALDGADEPEDFQAVGMRCRECLVELAQLLAAQLEDVAEPRPKAADFKAWSELAADAFAEGSSNERLRVYLKATSARAWEYVGWLTHARNATPFDARIAILISGHVVAASGLALVRAKVGEPPRCPECGSYRLVGDTRWHPTGDVVEQVTLCEACGWEDGEELHLIEAPQRDDTPPPEGDCRLTSEISTFMTPQDFIDRHPS